MPNPQVSLTVKLLCSSLEERLRLRWLNERYAENRPLAISGQDPLPLVGYLNLIHANQIQILGQAEFDYLNRQKNDRIAEILDELFPKECGILVLADFLRLPDKWLSACIEANIPVVSSPLAGHAIIEIIENYLSGQLGERTVSHGVLMEVHGVGVLITGESGIGKSELALELITRGHRLIADDCPEFKRVAPDTIDGSCPTTVQNFLEVRGLGIIDVPAMFGNGAIKRNKYLRLIINLQPLEKLDAKTIDRLSGMRREQHILEVAIPEITLPVTAGRNLAVLLEVAVKDHLLRLNGHHADELMISMQQAAIQSQ